MKEIRLCDDAEVLSVLNLCKNNGLGIEVQGFYNPNLIDTRESEELLLQYKKVLQDFKYGRSLHAPFWDLNLGTKNPMVKEATMKAFNYAYKVAKELGCTEIVVHNGFVPNTSFYEGWARNAVAFWNEFFSDKDNSITMMVENQCEEDSTVLKMEIDAVNDPRLKVCLDIGHAHANSNMSVEEWDSTYGYVYKELIAIKNKNTAKKNLLFICTSSLITSIIYILSLIFQLFLLKILLQKLFHFHLF